MNVVGIDAHATYMVASILNKQSERLTEPERVENEATGRLLELLEEHGPAEAVVETSPAWPWLHDLLEGSGGVPPIWWRP